MGHDSTRSGDMDSLEEPGREENEILFEHASDYQRTRLVCPILSRDYRKLSMRKSASFCVVCGIIYCICDILFPPYKFISVICRERECSEDGIGPNYCFTLK